MSHPRLRAGQRLARVPADLKLSEITSCMLLETSLFVPSVHKRFGLDIRVSVPQSPKQKYVCHCELPGSLDVLGAGKILLTAP